MSVPLGKAATMAGRRGEQKSLFQEILATLGSYRRTSPRRKVLDRRFWSPQKLTQSKTELPNPSTEHSPQATKPGQMIVLGSRLRTRPTARLGNKDLPDSSLKGTVRLGSGRLKDAGKTLSCIGTAVKIPF